MNANLNSTESFNELVFENRNKEYGAYVLRRSYNDTITRSLILTCLFFGGLVGIGILFTNDKFTLPVINKTNLPVIITTTIEIPHPDIKKTDPVVKPRDPSPPKTQTDVVEVTDSKTIASAKLNTDFPASNPSVTTTTSTTDGGIHGPVEPIESTTTPTSPAPIVAVPDKMPELPDMNKFISDNLRYPRTAIENGMTGTVYVTFVIETDGSVSNVQLIKGIGDGCEQEAMRVIKLMPKWKPGINKGKPVRVQCNLPVKFRLQ